MSGRSHRSWVINQYFRGVKCLAQGHNTAAVGFEPRTSRSGVRHSTTEPPRFPVLHLGFTIKDADRMANSVDPNQTALSDLAQTCPSENLASLW